MVPIDASTAGRRRMERAQSMELRKRAKINFVLMYVITSENESSFLSLILEANLCMDSWATLRIRIKLFHIKERSAEAWIEEIISFDI